uniref:Uncharacterized protein n=1 Tax=Arion vulgaris TaxID=1028688 RepID=A0A0B6ZYJ7_9EUPU
MSLFDTAQLNFVTQNNYWQSVQVTYLAQKRNAWQSVLLNLAQKRNILRSLSKLTIWHRT